MTILEKVNLTTGVGWEGEACVGNTGSVPRLGIRALCLQDSPTGIRFADWISVFPSGQTTAATWDRNLMYQRGLAMGRENKDKGIDITLGPVAGPLGRAPAGGRNWEGFSVDPVLTGVGMAETIKGIQDAGVIATAKHYIGNEQGKLYTRLPQQGTTNGLCLLTRAHRALPTGARGPRLWIQHFRISVIKHRRQNPPRTLPLALFRCRPGWCRRFYVLLQHGQQLVRLSELQAPERRLEGRAWLPRLRHVGLGCPARRSSVCCCRTW